MTYHYNNEQPLSCKEKIITALVLLVGMTLFCLYGYYFYKFCLDAYYFYPPAVKVCERDVAFIERRFGFDRRLDETEFAPTDHIVYTRNICHYE